MNIYIYQMFSIHYEKLFRYEKMVENFENEV